MSKHWGISVKSEMTIPRKTRELKSSCLRNAYSLNLEREYNAGTSLRHPTGMKMYAELARNRKCKKLGIKSPSGNKLVHEMDQSEIFFIDWRSLKLCSNGMFRIQRDPEGKQYFSVRNTTGYEYLVDIVFYGEQIVHRPSYMGVMYDISY